MNTCSVFVPSEQYYLNSPSFYFETYEVTNLIQAFSQAALWTKTCSS